MSADFVLQLRAPDETMSLGTVTPASVITVRVQMAEVWGVVRIATDSGTPVHELKRAALGQLYPQFVSQSDFLLKLNGFEVLDEAQSIASAGARNGSTFLLTFCKRRPVR